MADLEQFSEEGGRYGSRVWDVWKIRRGSSHRRSTNTQDPLPDPYPLKTIPLKCPDLVMLPLLGPLQPGSIRLQFRGCLTPIHANENISPIKNHHDDISCCPPHHDLMYEESKKRMVRCHLPADNLVHFVFTDQHSQRPTDCYSTTTPRRILLVLSDFLLLLQTH